MKYLYKYPQREFPYRDLVETNRRRTREELEYELLDTGIFDDDRYFDVFLEYAKEGPDDILIRVSVHNRGQEAARLQLLPTLWFRNTWSWGDEGAKPVLREAGGAIVASHPELGDYTLSCDGAPELLFTENESNAQRLWGQPNPTPYVKDAFHRYVISGERDAVNPAKTGTKAAARYVLEVPAGGCEVVQLRLAARPAKRDVRSGVRRRRFRQRLVDADEFYERITPRSLSEDERRVHRQALAGMLWTKQYYYFDLDRWLKEHEAHPLLGGARRGVRNTEWFHMLNGDVISMPDKWEYPWYAAWDLAFHTISLSLVDFDFAKEQLLLMLRSLYSHPNGQMPAYEWNFSDVNPPVHAWATLFLYKFEKNLGREDLPFLERSFQGLMLNFNWWVNRKDPQGRNVFAGGFLGLDNIGVFDRSAPLPTGGSLEQADGTAWMAFYCQNMLEMALILADHDPMYEEIAFKFLENFIWISYAMDKAGEHAGRHVGRGGRLLLRRAPAAGRRRVPAEGPLDGRAPAALREHDVRGGPGDAPPEAAGADRALQEAPPRGDRPRGPDRRRVHRPRRTPAPLAPHPAKLERILAYLLDENEFLGPYGIRSLSRHHLEHPFVFQRGGQEHRVEYLPAESNNGMFGGNSNWRGPVWMPVNVLLIRGLLNLYGFYGDDLKVECPTGSGNRMTLFEVAKEISTAPVRHLPARRERPPAGLRRLGEVPGRPALARSHPLLRVLPRRQRGRPRGQPPDGLDGPRRTPARPLRARDGRGRARDPQGEARCPHGPAAGGRGLGPRSC